MLMMMRKDGSDGDDNDDDDGDEYDGCDKYRLAYVVFGEHIAEGSNPLLVVVVRHWASRHGAVIMMNDEYDQDDGDDDE